MTLRLAPAENDVDIDLGVEEVRSLLPHRPPFLLVERVVSHDPGRRTVVESRVREDDFWVAGHFPGRPVLPGVLMVEMAGQAAGLAIALDAVDGTGGAGGSIGYFAGMRKVSFRRTVVPPARLTVTIDREGGTDAVAAYRFVVAEGGDSVCDGALTVAMSG